MYDLAVVEHTHIYTSEGDSRSAIVAQSETGADQRLLLLVLD